MAADLDPYSSEERRRKSALPRITISTVVKLLVASLIVGALMAWLNITPGSVLRFFTETLRDAIGDIGEWGQAAVSYVLLGAVIVVPIWLVIYLLGAANRRR